jgi:putative protease
MAIACPLCGRGFDVTLFQFGHSIQCDCGMWLDLQRGHTVLVPTQPAREFVMAEIEVGRVTHYFGKIGVAAIEITRDSLAVGDTIHIKGHTSDFMQKIDSMQIDNQAVEKAVAGQSIGIKAAEHARVHDIVYKVVD